MEDAKESCGGEKPLEENPIPVTEPETDTGPDPPSRLPSRTPFTSLSQIDADLALARTLQEQVKTLNSQARARVFSEIGPESIEIRAFNAFL